jgi:hypothetical protein
MKHCIRCFCAALALGAAAAAPCPLAADTLPLRTSAAIRLPLFPALYDGKIVYYISRDASDPTFAQQNGIPFAPRLAQAAEAAIPTFYSITNGVKGQVPVLGSVPGEADYNPIWRMVRVTWKNGAASKLLGSDDDIDAAMKAGQLTEEETSTLFDCPVVLMSDRADGAAPHLAPTLSLGPQVINWDVQPGMGGSAMLRVLPGWYEDQAFAFLNLEGAPAATMGGAAVMAVPALAVTVTGAGGKDPYAHFYQVQGQADPVLSSVPDDPDVQAIYSPLWYIFSVTFKPGQRPRELHSEAEIQSAVSSGAATSQPESVDAVFNCPVVNGAQVGPLPSASDEVGFLGKAGLLSSQQADKLQSDLSRGDDDAFRQDVNALVTAGSLQRETALMLFEMLS